jgi:pimeloyl-ACP methyl ester carboxylesterase
MPHNFPIHPSRRSFLAGTAALSLSPLLACTPRPQDAAVAVPQFDTYPPVIFVHGNGDTAALWHTTIWRWESAGFPDRRLFAVDFPYPLARSNDAEYQAGRSSTQDQFQQLSEAVASTLRQTGAGRVALVGSSRGGNAIRNYLKNGPGAAYVSHAILCGTPNHGVIVSNDKLVGSEFNGAGPFLRRLNSGLETVPGVEWMTIRSDAFDKFAQPDGAGIGMPGTPTGVTADGPALVGAKNIVLPSLDHREVAFHEKAFAATWDFIIGSPPATTKILPESAPVLNGKVSGMARGVPTNLPVEGATVEIWETNPQTGTRLRGEPLHRKVTGADGYWGPFNASPTASYEFVLTVPGQTITHIYRSPFPRSSAHVHLRTAVVADRDRQAGAIVMLSRPRGYFGSGRDVVTFDDQPAPGIPAGVPTVSTSTLALPQGTAQRSVVCRCNDETIVVQSWSATGDRAVIAEMHY